MLEVRRSGRYAADIGADLRALVTTEQPKILAQALTFTVQRAQKDIVEEMSSVFEGGATAYTKASTRIEPASVAKLVARVAVKDRTTNNGTLPEDYLFPEVYGGQRKEKRFERAMRYAGLLQGREYAVLGEEAPVDSFGNLKRGEIQRILTATRSAFDPYQRKTDSARSRRNAKNAPYFAARIGRKWGVWKRDGADPRPILIFVTKRPVYRQRLDFEATARRAAERDFAPTFNRLLLKAAGR
ncbi:hypothetical protein [Rubrivivax sp. JA1026]|uniref:hypothetical protein n=1 Tax=Rubrivivax sp. JA1026 TaxID=2710888 RepID=UPI0013E972A4|nr:hypothetical protein [Rubrivivax sp. JA1026]